jgi:hypothetical protein
VRRQGGWDAEHDGDDENQPEALQQTCLLQAQWIGKRLDEERPRQS